jgi:DNA helicase-2/ATP-dependent DNA helicase PcrA
MAVDISIRTAIPGSPSVGRFTDAPVPLRVVADLLRGLNRAQRAAVTHREGPLLVIAGPGTGKTEVITRRLAWLIATKRARPHDTLALTFTESVADEMQGRVDVLVPYGQADARIHTFHAFGDAVLREFAFELGLPGDVRLITRSEGVVLLRDNMFDLGLQFYRPLGDPTRFLSALVDLFQRAKDEDVSPEELTKWAARSGRAEGSDPDAWDRRRELGRVFERYERLLLGHGLIDHGDQIGLPLRLMREHAWIRDELRRRHRFVLVDEFQDLNPAQLHLLAELTAPDGNVTAVGDPDQAIYTFRGAGRDNIASFGDAHPDLQRIVLRRNYRSRQPIISAAHRLKASGGDAGPAAEPQIAHRRRGRSQEVRAIAFETPNDEADGIAGAIADAIAAGARPHDFAVLARSNHEIEPLAQALRVRKLPVRTHLPADFFSHPQVRPLLAFLRVVSDPGQTLELYALATSYPYSLGGERLTDLLALARRSHRSLWQQLGREIEGRESASEFENAAARLVADIRSAIGISHERTSTEVLYTYLRHSGRLAQLAASPDAGQPKAVSRFFDIVRRRARLLTHDRVAAVVPHLDALIEAEDELADTGPLDADAVSVLTVHRAKGLEFKVVYLTGLIDGRFPARGRPSAIHLPWNEIKGHDGAESDRLGEERRLAFVAMTRARDELWLTYHLNGMDGRGRRRASQFLSAAVESPLTASRESVEPMAQLAAHTEDSSQLSGEAPKPSIASAFSFSEIETYLECPERYRLRHVVGLPTAPHHALTYGSAMHQAVAAFHLAQKRGKTLSDAELQAAFAAAWSPEGFLSREHEEARFQAGLEALRRFRLAALESRVRVVAVERPFAYQLDDLTIRGRMDRVDETPGGAIVVDYKSSPVTDQGKADEKARQSLQLQVYAMAYEAETGDPPAEVRLHFLETGVVGTAKPDAARSARARQKLLQAAHGIRDREFAARPSAITCGYCPFRRICASSAA